MLFGPGDFLVLRREILSDISCGTEGAVKNEFHILSPIKFTGELFDLGMVLVIL